MILASANSESGFATITVVVTNLYAKPPHSALSCSRDLLTCLASLAASEPTLRIQTHISQNETGCRNSQKVCADVYDIFGLLCENTILAHAIHLTRDEVQLIKQIEVGLSHGIAPIGYFLDRGVQGKAIFLS